jgi:enamine deaminase RidA (YjgF/YER057c/UK114 family)
VPETPADGVTVAGIEGSGAGGERFQTPRGGVEADASDGGAADADVPEDPGVLLEPSARACTECNLRCRTRRELIDHLLETHGVEAREREEVDGPMGDLAGMQPFAGEEQHDIAPYALPGYDAHALGTPTRERRSGHNGTHGDATGPDARLADVEVVREMMIRQQTTDRQIDELKAENRAMRSMVDELRRHIALSADQTQIKRVASGDQDLGYAPITVFGRSVYLTGVVGSTCGHDVALQTGEALNRLKQILNKAGTDLAHVLRVTVYVSDIRFVEKMNFAWDKFFDVHQVERHLRPTRVTQAACLKFPEIHVEMHAEAVIPAPPLAEGVAGLLPGPTGATPA